MTQMTGTIERLGDVATRQGRMGEYKTRGVLLRTSEEGEARETVYGSLFGQHIDTLAALNAKFGDRIRVDALFTTSERNGFVSNYVEFRNPQLL